LLKIRSVAIAIGSSIQIALFVAPLLVLASYFIAPPPLNLVFSRGLLWTIFLTVLIGIMVAGDGRANWFNGVQLIMVYVIMAVMFYFLPNSQLARLVSLEIMHRQEKL
jgi:Ca2+:H+ antiporter